MKEEIDPNKKTILVVDDEQPIIDVLVCNLQREGYNTLDVIAHRHYEKSRLYAPDFSTEYRKASVEPQDNDWKGREYINMGNLWEMKIWKFAL